MTPRAACSGFGALEDSSPCASWLRLWSRLPPEPREGGEPVGTTPLPVEGEGADGRGEGEESERCRQTAARTSLSTGAVAAERGGRGERALRADGGKQDKQTRHVARRGGRRRFFSRSC